MGPPRFTRLKNGFWNVTPLRRKAGGQRAAAGFPCRFAGGIFQKRMCFIKTNLSTPGPVAMMGPGKLKHHVTPTSTSYRPPHNRGPRTEPGLRAQATATPARAGGYGRRRGGDCLAIPNRRCPRGGGKTAKLNPGRPGHLKRREGKFTRQPARSF